MALLPTTRFSIRVGDRTIPLAWNMAAIFARESDERSGEKITLLRMIFYMTRSAENAPTLDDLRAGLSGVSASQGAALLRAIGATKQLGETGGLPVPKTEPGEPPAEFSWRRALIRAVANLHIPVQEFWRMTPFELALRLDAELERRGEEFKFHAQMTANLMNVSGRQLRNQITGEDLLGRRSENYSPFLSQMDPAEKQRAMERIWEKVQRQRAAGKQQGGEA